MGVWAVLMGVVAGAGELTASRALRFRTRRTCRVGRNLTWPPLYRSPSIAPPPLCATEADRPWLHPLPTHELSIKRHHEAGAGGEAGRPGVQGLAVRFERVLIARWADSMAPAESRR